MEDGKVVFRYVGDTSDIDKSNREAESKIKSSGENIKKIGVGAAAAIGAACIAAAGYANKLGQEFETAMAGASTLFGSVNVDAQNLNSKMLSLSSETGQSAALLGTTLYDALSSGLPVTEDMGEAMKFLKQNTDLATGGFTDVAMASGVTLDIMNAYKLKLEDVDRIHKILMQTQNKGKITVGQLGDFLAQVTPTAAAFGFSFEQVGAAIATMTIAGTKPAQAVTALNALLSELGKSGQVAAVNLSEAAKGTEYAGMTFAQMTAAGVPLNQILDMMTVYAEKNGKSLIDMFGGIEAGNGALQLAGANSAAYTDSLAAMATQEDVVGKAAGEMKDTNAWKMQQAFTALKNVLIELYQNAIQPALAKLYDLGKWFSDHEGVVIVLTVAIVALTASILAYEVITNAAAIATALLTAKTSVLAAAQWLLNAAFLANPVGLVIAGIAAIVAAYALLVNAQDKAIQKAQDLADVEIAEHAKTAEAAKAEIQKTADADKAAHEATLASLRAAEQKKIEITKEALAKRTANLDKEHSAAIKAIQDEFGVFDTAEKSKTAKLQETQSAFESSLSSMLDTAKSTSSLQGKAFSESESKILQAARDTHNEKVRMFTEEYLLSLGIINSRLKSETKQYQDKIDANNAATKKEEANAKQSADAQKLSDLKKVVSNAKTTKERQLADKAYQDEVQRQATERIQAEREAENDSLNEKIKTATEKATEEKDALYLILTDRITAEQAIVTANTNFNISEIQRERLAKEEAENAKYEATRLSLENQTKALATALADWEIKQKAAAYSALARENAAYAEKVKKHNQEIRLVELDQQYKDTISDMQVLNAKYEKENQQAMWLSSLTGTPFRESKEMAAITKQINDLNATGRGIKQTAYYVAQGYATGTDNYPGGPIYNEQGGETVVFPSGAKIIPHDVSVEGYKQAVAASSAPPQQPIIIRQEASAGKADGDIYLTENIYLDSGSLIDTVTKKLTRSGRAKGTAPLSYGNVK